MLSPTYEITTALSHTDELISPPYDIAIVTISYGRVTMSFVWDSMMSKKNMGWPFYAAVIRQPGSRKRAGGSFNKAYNALSRDIDGINIPIALKFGRRLGSTAAESPCKFQSDMSISTPNLADSIIMIRCPIGYWNWPCVVQYKWGRDVSTEPGHDSIQLRIFSTISSLRQILSRSV